MKALCQVVEEYSSWLSVAKEMTALGSGVLKTRGGLQAQVGGELHQELAVVEGRQGPIAQHYQGIKSHLC